MLVVYAALLPILVADERGLLAMNRPYSPFTGHKFPMVSMALVAGQVWIQGNAALNVTNDNPRKLAVTPVTTAGGARLVQ